MDSDSSLHDSEMDSGCLSDRATALDEHKLFMVKHFCILIILPILGKWTLPTPNLYCIFKKIRVMVVKVTYLNAHRMADTNAFNVIHQSVIVGVFMKIRVKIFLEHRSKGPDQIVQSATIDQLKDVENKMMVISSRNLKISWEIKYREKLKGKKIFFSVRWLVYDFIFMEFIWRMQRTGNELEKWRWENCYNEFRMDR